jgi:hypothetical protein
MTAGRMSGVNANQRIREAQHVTRDDMLDFVGAQDFGPDESMKAPHPLQPIVGWDADVLGPGRLTEPEDPSSAH